MLIIICVSWKKVQDLSHAFEMTAKDKKTPTKTHHQLFNFLLLRGFSILGAITKNKPPREDASFHAWIAGAVFYALAFAIGLVRATPTTTHSLYLL